MTRFLVVISFVTIAVAARADSHPPNANELVSGPPKTEATLVHGGTRTKIDLRSPSDLAKIKDGDMILLEEGLYNFSQLPGRGVKIVGKARDKTVLAGGAFPGTKFTLKTKETQFWNLTLPSVEIDNDGVSWFVNVRFLYEPAAKISKRGGYPSSAAVLSMMSDHGVSITDPNHQFSHFGTFGITRYDDKFLAGMPGGAERYPQLAKFAVEAAESVRDNEGKIDADLAKKFFELRPTFDKELAGAAFPTLRVLSEFFAHETGVVPPGEIAKANEILAKAKTAKAQGAPFVAMILAKQASSLSMGQLPEASAIAGESSSEIGGEYACRFTYKIQHEGVSFRRFDLQYPNGYEEKYEKILRDGLIGYLMDRYPLLLGESAGDGCSVTLQTTRDAYRNGESVKKIETKSEWVESEAAKNRRRMFESAAARAASKAATARWNAATEAMASTAKKMYQGRVRTESYGGQNYLVYGQGNFTGTASAATKSALEAATAAGAEARRQAGANPDLVEKVTTTTTFFHTYEYTMGLNVEATAKGYKPMLLIGPITTERWSIGPCKRKDNAKVFDSCEGPFTAGTSGDFVNQGYLRTHVYPFLDQYIITSVLPRIFKKIDEASKSKSDARRLDAMILASRIGVVYDAKALASLSEKVLGKKLTPEELREQLN